jgi:hypothetical protein
MNGPCRSRFGLHFHNPEDLAKDILPSMGCPFIAILPHAAGGCNGVDGGHLTHGIGHVSSSFIPFDGLCLSVHIFLPCRWNFITVLDCKRQNIVIL